MVKRDNLTHGVHHIALGVKSLKSMRSFYENVLKLNHVLVEFPNGEHESLEEVFRMFPVEFAGVIFGQEAGGIYVELIQMINPSPHYIRSDFRYGDIGVNKITLAVPNLEQFYRHCQLSCVKLFSANLPKKGRFSATFPIGFDLQ